MVRKRFLGCIGGWSFMSLSIGIFILPFSSILCSVYAADGSVGRTVSLMLLCSSLALITGGTTLLIVWCLKGGQRSPGKGVDVPLSRMGGTSGMGSSEVTMLTCGVNGVESPPPGTGSDGSRPV